MSLRKSAHIILEDIGGVHGSLLNSSPEHCPQNTECVENLLH